MWGQPCVVKGVVRDFHFSALHKPIEPLLIHAGMTNQGFINNLVVRVQGENFEAITSAMTERWKKIVPASPFSFNFVNEQYDNLCKSESRLSRIMNVFFCARDIDRWFGLFGLASYTIMQRMKELGIRKVLGASVVGIAVGCVGRFYSIDHIVARDCYAHKLVCDGQLAGAFCLPGGFQLGDRDWRRCAGSADSSGYCFLSRFTKQHA